MHTKSRNETTSLYSLSGLSPFLGDNDAETLANVAATDWDFDDPVWDDISDVAKDFLCRLMVKDKSKRMTASEALQHPWITVRLLSFTFFHRMSYVLEKIRAHSSTFVSTKDANESTQMSTRLIKTHRVLSFVSLHLPSIHRSFAGTIT